MKHSPFFQSSTLSHAVRVSLVGIVLSSSTVAFSAESSMSSEIEDSVQTLPVITVQATETQEESYTVSSANTATKLDLSLRETPQTVQVFTREYLDDRNIESFQELLANITGVSISRTDERLRANARGFDVDYYLIDGMPSTLTLSDGDPDLGLYERVEVVKGANGLMTGAGNPAIGLNLIRKRATSNEFTGEVTASAGSWNNLSSTVDLSAPLNNDGSLRGRVFVKNSHEDSYMDFYERERRIAYGTLNFDMTDKTTLSVGASYQELERNGVRWGGLPAFYTDGTRTNFDRSLTVSSDWTYWNVDSTEFFANLKQNLFNDVNLNVAYAFRRDDVSTNILYIGGRVDKTTNTSDIANVSAYTSADTTNENNVDVYLSAPFTIANREQELVVGGSWNQTEEKSNTFGGSYYTGQNVLNVDALDYDNMNTRLVIPLERNQKNDLDQTTQSAAYIAGKFHLLDPLKAVAGLRVTNWEFQEEDTNGDGTTADAREFNNELTPYAGLIFDFADNYSWYASYTSIFKPQSRKDENGNYLDPVEGKSYETGLKGEFFDQRLNASVSVFRIEQDNFAQLLLDENGENVKIKDVQGNPTADNAYYGAEGTVSEGVELNVQGEINENWSLHFGVANFDAVDANDNEVSTTSSRTTADIFVKYKNEDWFAGAGVNYYSDIYSGSGQNRIERDDLYLANAMLGYHFDSNFSGQININNIFDKKYYEGIGANSMNYGDPRNATLTLKYKF